MMKINHHRWFIFENPNTICLQKTKVNMFKLEDKVTKMEIAAKYWNAEVVGILDENKIKLNIDRYDDLYE